VNETLRRLYIQKGLETLSVYGPSGIFSEIPGG